MNEEIDNMISYVKNNKMLKKVNNLLLTQEEIDILKRYGIAVEEYGSIDEILYELDEILNEDDYEELDMVYETLKERRYYELTNK